MRVGMARRHKSRTRNSRRLGLEQRPAVFAIIEELASVSRHCFAALMAALRASQSRFRDHRRVILHAFQET